MRVIALFRVSTEGQAERGSSLASQERRYDELAATNGWDTIDKFKGAESATQATADRRVLQQVLSRIREGGVDAIYVHEQSRLTRGDELDCAMLMRELREQNIKIIVNGLVRDPNSLEEAFMLDIQSAVDRNESRRIKERLMRGKREKARQGKKTTGPAPYGYRNPPPGDPKRGQLQIVPEEAAVVRRIFQMRAAGDRFPAIAAELKRLGVAPPRAGAWGKTTLNRMFQNPAYIGTVATNVWVEGRKKRSFVFRPDNPRATVVENAHEPIIDRAIWDAVHARPKAPTVKVPRMLTGLLYVNGARFGGDSDGPLRVYRGPRGVHGLPWLEARHTDAVVWDAFVSLAKGEEFIRQLMDRARDNREEVIVRNEIEFLEGNLVKAKRRLERLVDMRAGGEIDKATFLEKRRNEDDAIESMNKELAGYRARLLSCDGTQASRLAKVIQCIIGGNKKLTEGQRRQMLLSVVRRVDITAENIKCDFKRDANGRVLAGRTPRWEIREVRFQFELPPDSTEAARTQTGPTSGVYGASGAGGEERDLASSRPGQSDTTL